MALARHRLNDAAVTLPRPESIDNCRLVREELSGPSTFGKMESGLPQGDMVHVPTSMRPESITPLLVVLWEANSRPVSG